MYEKVMQKWVDKVFRLDYISYLLFKSLIETTVFIKLSGQTNT